MGASDVAGFLGGEGSSDFFQVGSLPDVDSVWGCIESIVSCRVCLSPGVNCLWGGTGSVDFCQVGLLSDVDFLWGGTESVDFC